MPSTTSAGAVGAVPLAPLPANSRPLPTPCLRTFFVFASCTSSICSSSMSVCTDLCAPRFSAASGRPRTLNSWLKQYRGPVPPRADASVSGGDESAKGLTPAAAVPGGCQRR